MSTPPTRRRRDPAERVRAIDAAARELALEHGLAAVTLRAVASRIDATPALVAHYIVGTEQLMADAFARIVGAELDAVLVLAAAQSGPRAAMSTILRELVRPAHLGVTAIWVDGWALGRRNPVLAERVRGETGRWRSAIAGIIRAGRDAGDFAVDDPEEAARGILATIDGINAHALVDGRDEQERAAVLARAAEAILGVRTAARPAG